MGVSSLCAEMTRLVFSAMARTDLALFQQITEGSKKLLSIGYNSFKYG